MAPPKPFFWVERGGGQQIFLKGRKNKRRGVVYIFFNVCIAVSKEFLNLTHKHQKEEEEESLRKIGKLFEREREKKEFLEPSGFCSTLMAREEENKTKNLKEKGFLFFGKRKD
jgi:hypothetical protein